jgi:hypothetical protein
LKTTREKGHSEEGEPTITEEQFEPKVGLEEATIICTPLILLFLLLLVLKEIFHIFGCINR